MFSRILLMLTATSLCACAGVVRVKEGTNKISGIPFYVKNEYFRQVSVYRETWFRLTLKAEKKLVDIKSGQEVLLDRGAQTFTAEVDDANNPSLMKIKAEILQADTSTVTDALNVIAAFQKLPSHIVSAKTYLLKNQVESEWVVDDNHPFYLNAPLPWFGAGNLTQKLSPEGTLTEVTSAPDTKLAEGLSTLLPTKEFLSGKYVKAPKAASVDPATTSDFAKGLMEFRARGGNTVPADKQYVFLLSLKIDEVGYETTLKGALQDTRPTIATAIPLAAGDPGSGAMTTVSASISRKAIEEAEEKPKDDSPTIGISGSIKLPKEKS